MNSQLEFINTVHSIVAQYGYLAIFAASLLESIIVTSIFLPGAVFLIFAGFFARQGHLSFPLIIIIGTLGMFLGDIINYYLGKSAWSTILSKTKFGKFILRKKKSSQDFIEHYGVFAIFYSHLLGYFRAFVGFSAGTINYPYKKYILASLGASFIWSVLFTGAGYILATGVTRTAMLDKQIVGTAWGILVIGIILKLGQDYLEKRLHHKKKNETK